MKDAEIIETIRSKLSIPGGRHLYGVLGSYPMIVRFAQQLRQAKIPDSTYFPLPISVNRGILDAIPDEEFRQLVLDEAKRPEPTAVHVTKAFESFLRSTINDNSVVVLWGLELLFAYHLELNLLRSMAADEHRIILLLPGKRENGRIIMFPDYDDGSYTIPSSLIAENHLWELK